MSEISNYYDEDWLRNTVQKHSHRGAVGGLWDQLGQLQFNYLRRKGLLPDMRLLDMGCGCLRGGVHFIRYLNAGNYYGMDLSQSLLDAGYDVELKEADLQDRMPRKNLRQSSSFDAAAFGTTFDAGLAISLFTHLPLNHIRLCLTRLTDAMRPGSCFYATAFVLPETLAWQEPHQHDPGGITTYPDRDPYHYQAADMAHVCHGLPWKLQGIEDWDHPRNQRMCIFERL